MAFGEMTVEQRAANLVKARQARINKALALEENAKNMKTVYVDEAHWEDLARKHKVKRLPLRLEPATAPLIRKWCTKLKVPLEVFEEHYTSTTYFVKNNPKWTIFAVVGLLLELKDELEGNQ